MEHGAVAAKAFTALIKQTAPKDGEPGKNRSLVIGETPKQPVILVSTKKPTNALSELQTMSRSLGAFKPVAIGQVIFEEGEVHVKVLKAANEPAVRKAFAEYFKLYKVTPPSQKVRLWQPDQWEAVEFAEDLHDTADAELAPSQAQPDAPGTTAPDDRATHYGQKIQAATEQVKKIAGLVQTRPEIRAAVVSATTHLNEARHRLEGADYAGVDTALEAMNTELKTALKQTAPAARLGTEAVADEKPPAGKEAASGSDPFVRMQKCRLIWESVRKRVASEIASLKRAVADEFDGDPEETAALDSLDQLDDILQSFDERLIDTLDEMFNEKIASKERDALLKEAKALIDEYLAYAQSNELVRKLDGDTPFGVKLSIGTTMTTSLKALQANLH